MKWRILLSTATMPLIFALLVGFTLYTTDDPFKIFVAVLFLVAVTGSRLLSDRKYVFDIVVTPEAIEIQYYTPLLKLKSLKVTRSDTTNMKLIDASWFDDYIATLYIKKEEESFRFVIVRDDQFQQLKTKLA